MANIGNAIIFNIYDIPWNTNEVIGISKNIRDDFSNFNITGGKECAIPPQWAWGTKHHRLLSFRESSQQVIGTLDYVYSQIYNNTLVLPSLHDMGTTTSDYEYTFVLWNSSFITKTYTVVREAWSGIIDDAGQSITLAPLSDRIINLTVTMDGDSVLNANIRFLDEQGVAVGHTLTGFRGMIWGFCPNKGLRETWEWKTEILPAWNRAEDRLALRVAPRVSFASEYTLQNAKEASRMEFMLYGQHHAVFSLPHFEQQTNTVVHSGDEFVQCDISLSPWQEGSLGVLWENVREAELFSVAKVTEAGLQLSLPVKKDLGDCLVMPVSRARISDEVQRNDDASNYAQFTVQMQLEESLSWEVAENCPQFADYDIWEQEFILSNSELQRSITSPIIILDNGLAPAMYFHTAPSALESFELTLSCNSLAEIKKTRAMLLRRQACVRPFWTSTHRADVRVIDTVLGDRTSMRVQGCGSAVPQINPHNQRKLLRIEMKDGTVLYRQIQRIVPVDEFTDDMQLLEPLSDNDVLPEDIFRISFMSLYRLASDSIEWSWNSTFQAQVRLRVTEVSQ